MATEERGLGEWACLAVVVEGPTHGWAVGSLLAPGAELGRVWSLSRPLTYRALDALLADGLVEEAGTEPGRGKPRTRLRATRRGRSAADRWLAEPVRHLRDVRTELLLKLVLLERRGRSTVPLLEAQLAASSPIIDGLTSHRPSDPVERWRRESARATERFLSGALRAARTRPSAH